MDEVMKAKAHLDLNLVRDLKGSKTKIYTNVLAAKWKLGKTWTHCWRREHRKNTEYLVYCFLVSVSTSISDLQESQAHETTEILEQVILTLSWAGSHWGIVNCTKSMRPEILHPQVLRELMNVTVRQGNSWLSLKDHEELGRFLRSRKKHLPSPGLARDSPVLWATTGQSASTPPERRWLRNWSWKSPLT